MQNTKLKSGILYICQDHRHTDCKVLRGGGGGGGLHKTALPPVNRLLYRQGTSVLQNDWSSGAEKNAGYSNQVRLVVVVVTTKFYNHNVGQTNSHTIHSSVAAANSFPLQPLPLFALPPPPYL